MLPHTRSLPLVFCFVFSPQAVIVLTSRRCDGAVVITHAWWIVLHWGMFHHTGDRWECVDLQITKEQPRPAVVLIGIRRCADLCDVTRQTNIFDITGGLRAEVRGPLGIAASVCSAAPAFPKAPSSFCSQSCSCLLSTLWKEKEMQE